MNRIVVTGCVALGTVGIFAAAMSGTRADPKSSSIYSERDLVVTLVTPTINQEVLPDLSDPGLNNVITVRFSSLLNPRDIIDNQNVVNRLSTKVEFLDSTFARLSGTPSVRQNIFTFDPFSAATPILSNGQYTLNMKTSIRNTRGRLLNNGTADYTATFSVGTDVYPPVLRRISPIQGQQGIDLQSKIVATFNEPIELSTLSGTMFLQDGSTNPPTTILGYYSLARHGFDIVITPDPCFGLPPKTNVQFIIQGAGALQTTTAAAVSDVFQNKFRRDNGLQWTVDPTISSLYHSPNGDFDELSGQFKLTFQTKGVRPSPVGLKPGGPMMNYPPPYASPCQAQLWLAPSCEVSGNCVNYTTDTSFGELDMRQFITRFNQGVTDFSLISILPNTPVKMGRPAGVTFDPRIIGQQAIPSQQFHTYVYIVDERTGTVEVVRSDNFKILGRFSGFSSPRDVSVSTDTAKSATTLYVSSFGANQLVGVDLESIAVTFGPQPGQPPGVSPCAAIKDNQKTRSIITVGAGPTEVSADSYLHQRVMVTNSLENSMTIVDVRTNKVLKTYDVGSFPISCDWCTINFGQIRFALIANQGGLNDPDGSISMYINSPPIAGLGFPGAAQVRDGVEATITDGIKNPTHVAGNIKWITPPPPANPPLTSVPLGWLVSNTGGRTVVDMRIQTAGLFGISVTPQIVGTFESGLNPTSACYDPFYPNAEVFMSVVGTGSVAVVDPNRSIAPTPILVPGVRRLFTCFSD